MTEILIKKVNGISQTGDMHILYEPYNFEHNALRDYFGIYWKDKYRRNAIILAYSKIRPSKQIDTMIAMSSEDNFIPESTFIKVLYKWLHINEPAFNLKFKAIDGREGQKYEDIKTGVDQRPDVIYSEDYIDPWMDEKKMIIQ